MASRAKQICAAPGCTRLTSGKYCDEHQPERADNRGNASERGYDWRWHKFRNHYLAQPEHQFCALHISPGCTVLADCVDHIQPLELGGAKYDPNNLQPACQNCNVAKGRRTIRGTWTFDKDSYSPQG